MLTTGSKFLIGSAVLATIAAIAYGLTQDGVMGTLGLVSAAVALAFLAGVNIYTGDANVWADEISTVETAPAALETPGDSVWPLVFAFGTVIVTVGLVTQQTLFVVGLLVMALSGAEWTAHAWADRASADRHHNANVRDRIANPLEFPLGAAVGIAIIVYTFSRVMLWLSATNTVIAFSIVGALIILIGFFLANRSGRKPRLAVGVITVGAVGLLAGGVAAGIDGQRTIHPHETTTELAADGDICTSPDAFDADKNASQSVGAQANVTAIVTLDKSGALTFQTVGPIESSAQMYLPRSNPNNVVFANKSGEPRRLSVSLGEDTADGSDKSIAVMQCTTLVNQDGKQNMTLTIGKPSVTAPDGYYFFVPGVDSARLELVVP